MENPCFYNDDEYPTLCIAEDGNCVAASSWGECLKGYAGKQYQEYKQAKTHKSRLIRSAALNEIYEVLKDDPAIMKKIEALDLEGVILNLL